MMKTVRSRPWLILQPWIGKGKFSSFYVVHKTQIFWPSVINANVLTLACSQDFDGSGPRRGFGRIVSRQGTDDSLNMFWKSSSITCCLSTYDFDELNFIYLLNLGRDGAENSSTRVCVS